MISTERSYNQVSDHIGGNYLNDVTCLFCFTGPQVVVVLQNNEHVYIIIHNWGAYDLMFSSNYSYARFVSAIPCHVGGQKNSPILWPQMC